MKIKNVFAKIILNSQGQKTIEAYFETEGGIFKGTAPAGVSCGQYEAVSIEAEKALSNVNDKIGPALKGKSIESQAKLDELLLELDGASNKANLGANAILAVSMAGLRALADGQNLPLYKFISSVSLQKLSMPKPCFLCLEGGKHGQSGLSVQEFMVAPQGDIFKENLETAQAIYQKLAEILAKKFGKKIAMGFEGGLVPALKKVEEALDLLARAVAESKVSLPIKFYLDVAASEFFDNGHYNFDGQKLSSQQLSVIYQQLAKDYPILLLEDPFEQNDFASWRLANNQLSIINNKLLVVGDDLTVTNVERMKMAKEQELCRAMIIKPNQIGAVTQTIEAAKLAKSFGWQIIVSHRAGETIDDFIADLAVGLGAEFIKAGSLAKPERAVKYQRLLEIAGEQR